MLKAGRVLTVCGGCGGAQLLRRAVATYNEQAGEEEQIELPDDTVASVAGSIAAINQLADDTRFLQLPHSFTTEVPPLLVNDPSQTPSTPKVG